MEQLGKYQLVRKIATGGMAEVWLAQADGPRGFSKQLVVKRILPHLAEEQSFVDMFLSEARLAAQLNHPNVVQIFDFGEADDTWFIAMEFIDGPSLRTLARRVGRTGENLPLALVARFIAAACEGLEYAHNLEDPDTGEPLGLVHRDISPDNVLVSRNGAVKVVDFGIAKASGQAHHTKTGSVKGKLAYMPPEQLMAEPLDRRADIYALGVVLYELLAGSKPHTGGSEAAMMRSILYEAPTPIRELRPELPDSLVQIVDRALAKERDHRYASCAEMQADLERFIQSTGEIAGAPQVAALLAEWAPPQPPPNGGEPTPDRRDKSQPRGSDARRQVDPRAARRSAATKDHLPVVAQGDDEPFGGKTETDGALRAQQPGGMPRWTALAAGGSVVAALAATGWLVLARGTASTTVTPPPPAQGAPAQPAASRPPEPAVPAPAPAPAPVPPPAAPGGAASEGTAPQPGAGTQVAGAEVGAPQPGPMPGPAQPGAGTQVAGAQVAGAQVGSAPQPGAGTQVAGAQGGAPKPGPGTQAVVAAAQRAAAEPKPAAQDPDAAAELPGRATRRDAQVEIVTDPPAQVYVNGAFVEPSPARVTAPPGRAQVRVFDSVRGVDKLFTVELSPGDNGRKVLAVASRPVEFRVTPWATVYVDGKKLGDTPFDGPVSLYEGKHKVKLVNPELGVNRALDLDVGTGPNVVKARLDVE